MSSAMTRIDQRQIPRRGCSRNRAAASKLSFMAHVLMENRNGLVVDTRLTKSTGPAERESAWMMAWRVARGERRRITLGGDKNYDTQQMVASLGAIGVTPHVAQNEHKHRSSVIDARTTRHPGYAVSQRKLKPRRGDFRVDQDRGRIAQDQASRAEAS
jgi:hypothetical protein